MGHLVDTSGTPLNKLFLKARRSACLFLFRAEGYPFTVLILQCNPIFLIVILFPMVGGGGRSGGGGVDSGSGGGGGGGGNGRGRDDGGSVSFTVAANYFDVCPHSINGII